MKLIIMEKDKIKLELIVIGAFVLLTVFTTLFKPYLLLVVTLVLILYWLNRNLIRSVWLSFLIVSLFFKAKYFVEPVTFVGKFLDYGSVVITKNYFIEFSDALLLILSYLVVRVKLLKKLSWKMIRLRGVDKLMLLVLLSGIVVSLTSSMTGVAWFSLFRLFKYMLIYWLGRAILEDNNLRKSSIKVILLFVIFNSILIIFQKINGGPVGLPIEGENLFHQYGSFDAESHLTYRPGGMTTSPNVMATVISMMVPMMLGLSKDSKERWVRVGFLVSLVALIFTGARVLWLLVFLVIGWMTRVGKIKMDEFKVNWRLAVVALALSMFILVPRLMSLETVFREGESGFYRWRHLQISQDILKKHPLGLGLNVFQYQIVKDYNSDYFFNDSSPAHNLEAQSLVGLGLIGGSLLLWVFWRLLREKLMSLSENQDNFEMLGVYLGMVIYLLAAQIHPWLLERPMAGLFWVLAGFNYDKET